MKKNVLIVVGCFVGALAIMFILGLYGLGMFKFFAPKTENVRREVFEATKSYSHGKIQDLAKYYEEHQKAKTAEDKAIIENVIRMRLAEFDASKVKSQKLQNFLTTVRGY